VAEAFSGPAVAVRRAADRFVTRTPWLESRHSFSFGPHYDSANTGFGALVASNDDVVAPGGGFDTHLHRDMEIVTWVLAGALAHEDDAGNAGVLLPGEVQRTSAGTGIRHSERNASEVEPVRFVQMWVLPETRGGEPSYAQAVVPVGEELTVVASGLPAHASDGAVSLGARAALLVARPRGGAVVPLPAGPRVHVYVARGAVQIRGSAGAARDDADGRAFAVRLTEGDALRVTNGSGGGGGGVPLEVAAAAERAELLVWQLDA